MARSRIVFLLPDLGGGGAQRVMLRFAGALDPAVHAVSVLSVGRSMTYASEVAPHLDLVSGDVPRLRQALPWIMRQVDAIRPDAIVSVMGYLNLALLGIRPLLAGRPRIVVREANLVAPTLRALPSWAPGRSLYRWLYPRASLVIAPGERIRADILAHAPGCRSSIRICPNPVDEAGLRARAVSPARPAGDGLRIVAAGRLTRQKGFDRLVDAFATLPGDAVLTIFGEGEEREALGRQAVALGVAGRMRLPGFTDDLPAAIAGADVFALSSRWEGLPNVALEALALGTPVVATSEACLEEVAARAPPGAVTIAEAGLPLARALAARQGSPTLSHPRPSLLPEDYRTGNACSRFASLLDEALRA